MTKENIQRTERQGIIEFYLKRGRIVGAEGIEWDDNFSDRRRVGGGGGGGGLPRLGNNRRTLHKPNGSVGSCSVDGDVVFVTVVVLHRWDFRFSTKVVFLMTVWGFVRKRKTTGNDWNGPGLLFRVGSGRVPLMSSGASDPLLNGPNTYGTMNSIQSGIGVGFVGLK